MKKNFVDFVIGCAVVIITSIPLHFLGVLIRSFVRVDVPYLPYITEAVIGLTTIVVVGCLAGIIYLLIQLTILFGQAGRTLNFKIRLSLRKIKDHGHGW